MRWYFWGKVKWSPLSHMADAPTLVTHGLGMNQMHSSAARGDERSQLATSRDDEVFRSYPFTSTQHVAAETEPTCWAGRGWKRGRRLCKGRAAVVPFAPVVYFVLCGILLGADPPDVTLCW